VRLASLNLLHGRSLSDGLVEPSRLREAVQLLAPDVVGLQEVDRDQPRSHRIDLTRTVAESLDAEHWRFAPALIGEPGATWRAAVDDEAPANRRTAWGSSPAIRCGRGMCSGSPQRRCGHRSCCPAPGS